MGTLCTPRSAGRRNSGTQIAVSNFQTAKAQKLQNYLSVIAKDVKKGCGIFPSACIFRQFFEG
jgi:hypothetical protein